MIFSTILTVALLALVLYGLLQYRSYPFVGRAIPVVCSLGIAVSWYPERATEVAALVGVGRGTDLMLYVWVLASLLLFMVLHLKLLSHERRVTELARAMAITSARAPEAHTESSLPRHEPSPAE